VPDRDPPRSLFGPRWPLAAGGPSVACRARGLVEAATTAFVWRPRSERTVVRALFEWADARPADRFLWFEGRWWTVGEVAAAVRRHARAHRALGARRGDVVALLMDNRPEYLFHFYGLLSIGAAASLVNPNLRGEPLRRTILAAGARRLVVGAASLPAVAALGSGALGPVEVFVDVEPGALRPDAGLPSFDALAAAQPDEPLDLPCGQAMEELAAFVFTSGTTGLPKPAVVKHHRFARAAGAFGGVLALGPDDCVYLCLPLYHGNATVIGVPAAIAHRSRVALARRLSVTRFWSDCREAGATTFVYVGELCRYLYAAPAGPDDTAHGVRRAAGNGLRADLWGPFTARFGLARVHEFYAATEGNAETINVLGIPGTCGPLFPWKMALVRWDHERGAPHRGAGGLCERAAPGEPGLLVGKITARNEYAGYSDPAATRRKILRDVFARGDAWFDTGDLLRRDRLYNLSFVDRLGDTFRWKGENVSTQEVAEVLHAVPGVVEANVFGVIVPGHEGRAGMAALVLDGTFTPAAFYRHVADRLPAYAQPRFLRQVGAMDLTGTFRHRKVDAREEGFGERVTDPLWLRDPAGRTYVPLDPVRRRAVLDGRWPL
jgi:acyl-CoA synthetase (AMP-forming)/AMP-acid ligase II